ASMSTARYFFRPRFVRFRPSLSVSWNATTTVPPGVTAGELPHAWLHAWPPFAPVQNEADPEIAIGADQVEPPSWLTESTTGARITLPPFPPLPMTYLIHVTSTLPSPQATTA